MRNVVNCIDTTTRDWQWSADGSMGSKVLNTDSSTGDRTVLLRSQPRPVNDKTRQRRHYHQGAEEFLSLGPAFSFDNDVWLPRMAYVYLPPKTIHGTNVQVPDGYVLYLRTHGAAVPIALDPATPELPAGTHMMSNQPDVVVLPESKPPTITHSEKERLPARDVIGRYSGTGGETALMRVPAGFCGTISLGGSSRATQREIFVIDGALTLGDGTMWRADCYACIDADRAVDVAQTTADTLILVSDCVGGHAAHS